MSAMDVKKESGNPMVKKETSGAEGTQGYRAAPKRAKIVDFSLAEKWRTAGWSESSYVTRGALCVGWVRSWSMSLTWKPWGWTLRWWLWLLSTTVPRQRLSKPLPLTSWKLRSRGGHPLKQSTHTMDTYRVWHIHYTGFTQVLWRYGIWHEI